MINDDSSGASSVLPTRLTPFLGRRREVADARRLLRSSRLVTLTGAGGIGKTRVALHIAAEAGRAFSGGVRFVDLATITDGHRVLDELISALFDRRRTSKSGQPTGPVPPPALEQLPQQRILLVLDTCEHVAAGCARAVDQLLHAAPGLCVLVTSRHTLGVEGEHLLPVPPLELPDLRRPQCAATTARYDAVRLLVARAQAVQPGFAVTDENAAAVARLCVLLDGIPLALELAAIWLRTLTVRQVIERVSGRSALVSWSPVAPPRQQSLQSLVEWSYVLCSTEQRLLWARLSVFDGSFDLAAVEAVCSDARLPRENVLDVLNQLVAQSVVVPEHDASGVRYRLLGTIRRYGSEQLERAGDTAEVVRRHRDHYLGVVEEAADRSCGPHQQGDLARLRADRGNLDAALEACLGRPPMAGRPDLTAGLRLVAGLRDHWRAVPLGEGQALVDRMLAVPGAPGAQRIRALRVAVGLHLLQGDAATAAGQLAEYEVLGRLLGDEREIARATSLRGTAALFAGDLEVAARCFQTARARFALLGDGADLLRAQVQHAITLVHLGAGAAARVICEEALALSEAHGELLCRSYTLWVLGFESWRRGDVSEGERCVRRGLVIQRGFCDRVGAALMIEVLAWMAASAGEFRSAARRLAAAGVSWAAAGTTIGAFGPPLTVLHDACVARLQGAGVAVSGPWSAATPLGEVIDAVLADVPAGCQDPQSLRATLRAGADPAARRVQDALPATQPTAGPGRGARLVGVTTDLLPGEGLTARELAVAELVADGLSNRAVAAALVISPRTVGGHIERILAKLGFSSRVQVAAWVAARRTDG